MCLLCTFMANWISILTYTLQWELIYHWSASWEYELDLWTLILTRKVPLLRALSLVLRFLELITSNEWGMPLLIWQPHWYYLWYGIKTYGNVVPLLPYWLAYSGQKQNKHLATTQTMTHYCSFLTSGNNVTDITFHT